MCCTCKVVVVAFCKLDLLLFFTVLLDFLSSLRKLFGAEVSFSGHD